MSISRAIKVLTNLLAIILMITLLQPAKYVAAEKIPPYIERTAAGIYIGKSSIGNIKSLLGYAANSEIDGKPTICYQHPDTKEILTITFDPATGKAETVEISAEQKENCHILKVGFPSFFTGKGVSLGMKFRKTLPIYGKPHRFIIEELTNDEMNFILVNHPGAYLPEDGEEGEGSYIKVDIPPELSTKDFRRAYGQPEKIVGVHKTAIYSFHTSHEKVTSLINFYDLELHVLKGKIVKIIVHDGD